MPKSHVEKWNKAAKCFDNFAAGGERRYGPYKKSLFAKSRGKVMLVAAGTGLDFQYFPEGLEITAIDFSPNMIEEAKEKAKKYNGKLEIVLADVMKLDMQDETFDTVVTACTFCSVPDPIKGLQEIHRVLKSDGQLLMFEHVRAGNTILGKMMDITAPLFSMIGPVINRRTGDNIKAAGFRLTREYNIYLDMVKLFEAVKA